MSQYDNNYSIDVKLKLLFKTLNREVMTIPSTIYLHEQTLFSLPLSCSVDQKIKIKQETISPQTSSGLRKL